MKRVFVLFGMSGAGKSHIIKLLQERTGLPRIKTTTTRPQRNEQDNEYNFVTTEEFLSRRSDFVAVRCYNAILEDVYKDYYYGVDMKLLEDGGLMITDLDGLTELFESGCNVCGIYIHADQEVRLQRALNRPGFKQEEYERRNADDLSKFAIERIVELGTRYPVYAVDNSNAPAEEVAERVHRILVRDELKALLDSIKE